MIAVGRASEISLPGTVSIFGVEHEVDLVMVPDVGIGDYVVVHSGYAIEVIPGERARQTIELLLGAGGGEADRLS